jgi:MFS family permease
MKAPRGLWPYLSGAAAARAGDEMSGPALLLLGFAVTGRPGTGSELLASLTIAAAVGGPAFGAVLDRSRRPDRVLAATLAGYALGLVAIDAAVGRLPIPLVVVVALAAGLFSPAVAGGWTAQLPRIVAGPGLARASALDSVSFSAASLAGPALAALIAAAFGARWAVVTAAALVGLAVPAAAAVAPGWLTVLALAVGGAGEGPQLTSLLAVRHRETPERVRGQVYTTGPSLKIAGFAAGAALAGPLAGRSVAACLFVAVGFQLCAAVAYLLTGSGGRAPAETSPARASTGAVGDTTARSE